MTEDEMVGWHHQLNGHGFEQWSTQWLTNSTQSTQWSWVCPPLGDSGGQGSLPGSPLRP